MIRYVRHNDYSKPLWLRHMTVVDLPPTCPPTWLPLAVRRFRHPDQDDRHRASLLEAGIMVQGNGLTWADQSEARELPTKVLLYGRCKPVTSRTYQPTCAAAADGTRRISWAHVPGSVRAESTTALPTLATLSLPRATTTTPLARAIPLQPQTHLIP